MNIERRTSKFEFWNCISIVACPLADACWLVGTDSARYAAL